MYVHVIMLIRPLCVTSLMLHSVKVPKIRLTKLKCTAASVTANDFTTTINITNTTNNDVELQKFVQIK